jgi:hypothetical protein
MGRRLRLVVATSVLLVLLAGCQISGAASGSPGSRGQCTPQTIQQVVERFIAAFNQGDLVQLDQLVSSQQFSRYSTSAPGQRLNAEAYDRSSLVAYFAARHQQHEHLVLDSINVTYTNATQGGFSFRATRSADDGLAPTRYDGKGGIQCATAPTSLIVWSMDANPWSPLELLPEAAALMLLTAVVGTIVMWRRRKSPRLSASAHTTIPR